MPTPVPTSRWASRLSRNYDFLGDVERPDTCENEALLGMRDDPTPSTTLSLRDRGRFERALVSAMKIVLFDGEATEQSSADNHLRAPFISHHYDNSMGELIFSPDSRALASWSVVVALTAIVSLVITPFDIATRRAGGELGWLVFDMFVCFVFAVDVVVNFNVAFMRKSALGRGGGVENLVYDRQKIGHRYARGWLPLELVCVIPYELAGRSIHSMKSLRAIKLVRLGQSNQMYHRALLHNVTGRLGFLILIECLGMFLFCAHLMSTFWVDLALLESGHTWLDALADSKSGVGAAGIILKNPLRLWLWSMYYAITLVTTVGFGDVTPQTDAECVVSMAGMCIGTLVYATILTTINDTISRFDFHRLNFEKEMDDCRNMLRGFGVRGVLAADVIDYLKNCQEISDLQERQKLLDRLSPLLRGRISEALLGTQLRRISFIQYLDTKPHLVEAELFLLEMCQLFEMRVLGREDVISRNKLTIVHRGAVSAMYGDRFIVCTSGSVLGDDVYITNCKNWKFLEAICLTNTVVMSLTHSRLQELLLHFPRLKKHVLACNMWNALFRRILSERRNCARPTQSTGAVSLMFRKSSLRKTTVAGEGGTEGADNSPGHHAKFNLGSRAGRISRIIGCGGGDGTSVLDVPEPETLVVEETAEQPPDGVELAVACVEASVVALSREVRLLRRSQAPGTRTSDVGRLLRLGSHRKSASKLKPALWGIFSLRRARMHSHKRHKQ